MRIPSYRLHKATNQAVVVIKGKSFYLGVYGTPESREKYERLIGQYLAQGRRTPVRKAQRGSLRVEQLTAAYLVHCESYYGIEEFKGIRSLCRRLNSLFGSMAAAGMSPLRVKELRESMIVAANSRKYINKQVGRMVAMFGWAVQEEMIPPHVYADHVRSLVRMGVLNLSHDSHGLSHVRKRTYVDNQDRTLSVTCKIPSRWNFACAVMVTGGTSLATGGTNHRHSCRFTSSRRRLTRSDATAVNRDF
jgi:hypothetical protein